MSKEEKKNILIYSFSGLLLLTLITFAGIKNNGRSVENVKVEIFDQEGIFFTDQLEVVDLMTDKSEDYVIGVEMRDLDPKVLEERVETNPFVKDAQVYRDLKGNLQVKVEQSKPIARLFIDGKKDRYIDEDGRVLPINAKHTARVPLMETEFEFMWEKNLNESKFGRQVFELLTFIEKDEFWKAQIAHIFIRKDGEIELFPQVTKQVVEFGKPEDLERKFSKLMTFYKEILPKKGWNTYDRVNLKFENQIICE
ncbi:cell division protein FtsQ [Ekhidna sp.]|jgi:cell division protein FtsQ|uniref:cell division protein FtsQ/DivIB n=1 Tax=Ekhidna sp. TaxID=2608089 RepID=UPI0032EB8C10